MKVEIALREKRLVFQRISVPYSAASGYDPKHPDVVRINPKRQVPVLVHGALEVFDSTQIFEYLEDLAPEPPLWPSTIIDRAHARQLELKSDEVYFPHVIRLMGLQAELTDAAAVAAIDGARNYYAEMERLLEGRQFFVDALTYADIAFYMAQLFGERMGAQLTAATPRLIHWRARMTARAAIRSTLAPFVDHLRSLDRPIPKHLSEAV